MASRLLLCNQSLQRAHLIPGFPTKNQRLNFMSLAVSTSLLFPEPIVFTPCSLSNCKPLAAKVISTSSKNSASLVFTRPSFDNLFLPATKSLLHLMLADELPCTSRTRRFKFREVSPETAPQKRTSRIYCSSSLSLKLWTHSISGK